jgi:hypothetical protein
MTDQLVAAQWVLTFAEPLEVVRTNFSLKFPCLSLSTEPLAFNRISFAVIALLGTSVFSFEVSFGLAGGERLTESHHSDCAQTLGYQSEG